MAAVGKLHPERAGSAWLLPAFAQFTRSPYKNELVRNRARLAVYCADLTAEVGFEGAIRGGERLPHFEQK